jgi:hypothetical protein
MTVSINKQQAFAALDSFAGARVQLIQELKDAGCSLETAKDVVIEWACTKTGGSFTVKANGAVKLDSSHKRYNTTKCIVRDMMLNIQGTTRRATTTQAKTEPVDRVAKIAKEAATWTAAEKRRLIKLLSA